MELDADHQKVTCVTKSLPGIRFGRPQPAQGPLEAGSILLGPTYWIDEKTDVKSEIYSTQQQRGLKEVNTHLTLEEATARRNTPQNARRSESVEGFGGGGS
ncbi:hypothetical protein PGT21_010561 [Puccinia graminis f. sp. tritici]|uniref:Uncharacterized protein n=1 Tax=Puccinia graminis f. sp. tritici TaxID=56615 RepID=A0A5B0LUV1_PUCGR|nr:hypothetical protein PGT21_010561 [Puccinia graminis f. sp. tritici]